MVYVSLFPLNLPISTLFSYKAFFLTIPLRPVCAPYIFLDVWSSMGVWFTYQGLHCKGFSGESILTARSQGITQSHTMQQTPHKKFIKGKARMAAASEWEHRQQWAG